MEIGLEVEIQDVKERRGVVKHNANVKIRLFLDTLSHETRHPNRRKHEKTNFSSAGGAS